jgi:DNA polymerase family B/C4-type zinc-finger of DNA polymerase delta
MVKRAMKQEDVHGNRDLYRVLNARQFGLKMIANVTYGYTAAGFSGRMPCADIADAIVQTGRKTLESAISIVNQHEDWRAEVVYSDTDSLFVRVRGRSRADAFRIGNAIVRTVNLQHPAPVELELEKIYQPSVLCSKKRYVGFKYESPDQLLPDFEAKGIETVRRDSCPIVSKVLEKCIRLLFSTKDLSGVRLYLARQWRNILRGDNVDINDFVFAREVKLGRYSARGTLPPAAIVSSKQMVLDPRAEPLYGQRIPYVVVEGAPGSRLVDLVVSPYELISKPHELRLNAKYYIVKQINPSLCRIFHLVGGDIDAWFSSLARPRPLPMPSLSAIPTSSMRSSRTITNAAYTQHAIQHQRKQNASVAHLVRGFHSYGSSNAAAAAAAATVSTAVDLTLDDSDAHTATLRNQTRAVPRAPRTTTIEQYYSSHHCVLCGTQVQSGICQHCRDNPQLAHLESMRRLNELEHKSAQQRTICRLCSSTPTSQPVECVSLDCPMMFRRFDTQTKLWTLQHQLCTSFK